MVVWRGGCLVFEFVCEIGDGFSDVEEGSFDIDDIGVLGFQHGAMGCLVFLDGVLGGLNVVDGFLVGVKLLYGLIKAGHGSSGILDVAGEGKGE